MRRFIRTLKRRSVYPSLTAWFHGDDLDPGGKDLNKETGEKGSESDRRRQERSASASRKNEMGYRPVEGLNIPYPKIPTEMDHFIFRDMKSHEHVFSHSFF